MHAFWQEGDPPGMPTRGVAMTWGNPDLGVTLTWNQACGGCSLYVLLLWDEGTKASGAEGHACHGLQLTGEEGEAMCCPTPCPAGVCPWSPGCLPGSGTEPHCTH